MVSVLTKSFGLEHIEIAEDIVSDTFLLALDSWPYKGVPPNPTAWLYTVAKNKTKNHLTRQDTFQKKVAVNSAPVNDAHEIQIDFSDKNIADSQLQMLFALCHPSLSPEAQISLALRILCGLGPNEIADAFLTNKETKHKRLQRARKKLNTEKIQLEMPDIHQIEKRLATVLHTIYLLFSEGYYSESNKAIIREELCIEALNLTYLLLGNPLTNNHATNSLMALLCFQSSRLGARKSEIGEIVLYDDQAKSRWDTAFIEKGFYYLRQASQWATTSKYYIEASIAYWYTVDDGHSDKWKSVLNLYDLLIAIDGSPVIRLNRIWAYFKVNGAKAAIETAEEMGLENNHFYFMLLAELYLQVDPFKSMEHYQQAYFLCKNSTEKKMILKKIHLVNETQLSDRNSME